jgi:hypothetical protein
MDQQSRRGEAITGIVKFLVAMRGGRNNVGDELS